MGSTRESKGPQEPAAWARVKHGRIISVFHDKGAAEFLSGFAASELVPLYLRPQPAPAVQGEPEGVRSLLVECERDLCCPDPAQRQVTASKILRMLAASTAPAVHGEPVALAASAQKPVGYVSQDFLDGKWSLDHIAKSDEGQISRTIPVFAKPPQPAELQPDAAPAAHGPLFLSDEKILEIASNPMVTPCSPWWLKNDVKSGDVQNSAIAFARAVLKAAAPAVQGEPVAWIVRHPHFCGKFTDDKETAEHWESNEQGCTAPMFLHSQPAPAIISKKLRKDVAGLLICDECHDKCADPYTGLFASHCPDEEPCIMCECSSLRRQLAEQQPAPDVEALVSALEQCITSMLDSGYRINSVAVRAARTALAAYRKKGGEE